MDMKVEDYFAYPDRRGRFGDYGGSYVAETLMAPLEELRAAYFALREDPKFLAELARVKTRPIASMPSSTLRRTSSMRVMPQNLMRVLTGALS